MNTVNYMYGTHRKTGSKSSAQSIGWLNKLYRYLLFATFSPMKMGRLEVYLPEGTSKVFGGSGEGAIAEIRVKNDDFFKKCILHGDIGFGDSFVDGDWESPNVADVISWFILNIEHSPGISGSKKEGKLLNWMRLLNRMEHRWRANTPGGSRENIYKHYDLGNEFFSQFLDSTMTYSCAYFRFPHETLEEAQKNKYESICRKLRVRARDHVLEIGCGWGGFAVYAAKKYGCRVTGITISKKQYAFAVQRVKESGLERLVSIELTDYRDVEGQYDKIVSIEMLEAVGDGYLESFFSKCDQVLKRDGLLGIQYITCPDNRYENLKKNVDWIQKRVFPGSLLLSIGRVNQALNRKTELFMHQLDDLGQSYVATLAMWLEKFQMNLNHLRGHGYDESFIRLWSYYLIYCKVAFQMRNISVVQAVYTRPNNHLLVKETL